MGWPCCVSSADECESGWPILGSHGIFLQILPWLAFTILTFNFNYLCLVWMSLPTTTSLSDTQPTPLTCAGYAIPHHQTKKTIMFVCLSWHSYLLRCRYSFSPYPSWHAPSGSNSPLLLLDNMSSQQDISPKRAWAGTPK